MTNLKYFFLIYLIILLNTGCPTLNNGSNGSKYNTNNNSKPLSDEFNDFDTSKWHKANGYSNGSIFNCTWRECQTYFTNDNLILALNTDTGSPPYKSGEYRTNDFYSYGLYEVSMKPAKNTGIVSSFFTYTGPSDGNPWDEIDIEFLGKDTTKVQFNYFKNGIGGHEFLYNLGFDAVFAYHKYGFKWEPDKITWYVDGNAVHAATSNIPSTPGRIMMNLWPGTGVDSWLGTYNGVTPLYAYYDWVKFTP